MLISAVPPELINKAWPKVEKMIKEAMDRVPGRYTTTHLQLLLREARAVLWIILDDRNGSDEIIGAITTSIYNLPQGRVLAAEFAGGRDAARWTGDAARVIENYAKDMGCKKVEYIGRKGWMRWLKPRGYKLLHCTFEKDL